MQIAIRRSRKVFPGAQFRCRLCPKGGFFSGPGFGTKNNGLVRFFIKDSWGMRKASALRPGGRLGQLWHPGPCCQRGTAFSTVMLQHGPHYVNFVEAIVATLRPRACPVCRACPLWPTWQTLPNLPAVSQGLGLPRLLRSVDIPQTSRLTNVSAVTPLTTLGEACGCTLDAFPNGLLCCCSSLPDLRSRQHRKKSLPYT
jgi:hypothetical protein